MGPSSAAFTRSVRKRSRTCKGVVRAWSFFTTIEPATTSIAKPASCLTPQVRSTKLAFGVLQDQGGRAPLRYFAAVHCGHAGEFFSWDEFFDPFSVLFTTKRVGILFPHENIPKYPLETAIMTVLVTPSNAMTVLSKIGLELAETSDLRQILGCRDQAEIIRQCIKTAAFGLERQNQAAEMRLRCERRVGQILTELHLQGGDHKSKDRDPGVNLEDLGISRRKSSYWQQEGLLPEEDFVRYVEQADRENRELTSSGVRRLARLFVKSSKPAADGKDPFNGLTQGLKSLARQQKHFACIYAEPPWSSGGRKGEIARLSKRLCSLPVKLVAAPQAHLHLWRRRRRWRRGLRSCGRGASATSPCSREARCRSAMATTGGRNTTCSCWACVDTFPSATAACRVGWMGAMVSPQTRSARSSPLIARVSSPPYLDLFETTVSTGWTTVAPA